MAGKINYQAYFSLTIIRKRQQMPSSSHFKVDLRNLHQSHFHSNNKVQNIFHLQKFCHIKNAFKWFLLSFLFMWLVGIAFFASSSTNSSDIIQGKNFNYVSKYIVHKKQAWISWMTHICIHTSFLYALYDPKAYFGMTSTLKFCKKKK